MTSDEREEALKALETDSSLMNDTVVSFAIVCNESGAEMVNVEHLITDRHVPLHAFNQ